MILKKENKRKNDMYEIRITFPQDFKATLLKKDQSKEERKIKDHKLFYNV